MTMIERDVEGPMPDMIVMDAATATQLRGETAPGNALDPIPLADGETYILPLAVLEDPAHGVVHELLAGLTVRDVALEELVAADEGP